MLLVERGQVLESSFVFVYNGQVYDPTARSTPVDIIFSVLRGETGSGPVVNGPFSYFRELASDSSDFQITKNDSGQFTFTYKVPSSLIEGVYTIYAQTVDDFGLNFVTIPFQIKGEIATLNPIVISGNTSTVINYRPTYEDLNRANTNTLCLIGHADGIGLNDPIKIRSVQSAIDLLGADLRSPLLRGVLDAYEAGARDIFIMAAAPLSEYVELYSDRNIPSSLYEVSQAVPGVKTFYQKYYERLNETYSVLKELDYIDYIVPLEASIIQTGDVDFITQLAIHLSDFHNLTGFVQMGVIGSRSGGITSGDLDEIRNSPIFKNKLTQFRLDGTVASDIGRFIIPIYGEAVVQHSQIKSSYTSSIAASYAGMFTSVPLNVGLIRTRVPGLLSVFGNDLTNAEILELESLGVNTVYRGKRTRRSTPYEVYVTNEYTLAKSDSSLSKAAQMRLIATVISQVKYLSDQAIGRFGYERVVDGVRELLEQMKELSAIVDFAFKVELDPNIRGKIIFHIQLLSALGLKKLDFSIAAGPEV